MRKSLAARLRTNPKLLLASGRWALTLAWSTSPAMLCAVAVMSLIRGVTPAALALVARHIINSTIEAATSSSPNIRGVVPWLAAGLALTALEGIGAIARRFFGQRLRDDLNYRVTGDLLTHAARLDVSYFEDPQSQDVLERAKRDPADSVASFVSELLSCGAGVIQIASLLSVLVFVEPPVLAIVVVAALPFAWHQWRLALGRYALEHSRTTKRRWTSYFTWSLTDRNAVSEVKLLRLGPLLIDKFRSLMAEFRDQDRALYAREARAGNLFVIVTSIGTYTLLLHVITRVVSGNLTIGDLAIFSGAATRLRVALEVLIAELGDILQCTLHIANVMEFFAAQPHNLHTGTRPMRAERGDIELVDVRFSYPGAKEPTLDGVSLTIRAGETVALVGENGAGKTTLVKLIAGLYAPDAGSIRLDGVDMRQMSPDDICDRIAFVFQSFGRYEATAADNIAYGDWPRLVGNRAAVRQIARLAGVEPMIEALPEGYDTLLGRSFGQAELSGGQWQKIAMARAFARDAAFLIFDEPTSNLDAQSEYELFSRFQQLASGRATIIVSHRFSTVSQADRIYVLERGRIVESGTHAELVAQAGSYAHLYRLHSMALGTA